MGKFEARKPYCVEQVEEIANALKKSKEREIQNNFAKIDFVKTLENIQKYCCRTRCNECKFDVCGDCQIDLLFVELASIPKDWDIEKIKEILDE